MLKKSVMKSFICFLLAVCFIPAFSQSPEDLFNQMTLRQRVATLFVVNAKASEVVSMAPFGQMANSLPKASVFKSNGLILADMATGFEDSLTVPFPDGDSFSVCGIDKAHQLCVSFLSLYSQIGGMVTPIMANSNSLLKIGEGLPLPDRLLIFRDLPINNQWQVAGLIRLPLAMFAVKPMKVPNKKGEEEEDATKLSIVNPLDPNKLGLSFSDILKLPYLFSTDNLMLDVDRLCKAYENNHIDKTLFDQRVKWAIGLSQTAGKVASHMPSVFQIEKHLALRAKVNDESFVLAQNKQFLPLTNMQLSNVEWVDLRRTKMGDVPGVVHFHQFNANWMEDRKSVV